MLVRYIVYTSSQEVIICIPHYETDTIKEYFTDGGRNIEDYDREEVMDTSICISSKLRIE